MDKITAYEIISYEWQCPACGHNQTEQSCPIEEVVCDECYERYEVREVK